jgi:hypothetical protein
MNRTSAQPAARPAKAHVTAPTAPWPAASLLTAAPSSSGARTPNALPTRVKPRASETRQRRPGALERNTSRKRSPIAPQNRTRVAGGAIAPDTASRVDGAEPKPLIGPRRA